MKGNPLLGIIGGSGLYSMEGLESIEELELETPFGQPSSPVLTGILNGKAIAFISRHGRDHRLSPSEINYRANIYALKKLGVVQVLSVSACGSLREDYAPGDVVIPDQLFDFTKKRKSTFFDNGLVAHVDVADPFCTHFSATVADSINKAQGTVHRGGTAITIEGPRFSTRAESNTFRAWGMSIIGMTTAPEAFLAREAELCYAVMAHVTDYDVWYLAQEPVTVEIVLRILKSNTALALQAISHLLNHLDENHTCECTNALNRALVTNPQNIQAETRERLSILVDKYLS
ncbi:MAG: S-methyl-5'-thioadenosine phosphorylase [Chloroflexi bacterium]|nr:S-methyl-5'-thioadenosine phosphorylase [Chloroflexota bacterium]